jgi:2-dehydro-3-deoxygluconokinase
MGECLVELAADPQGQLHKGFSGDVYSVAVYLRRESPATQVTLLSALGNDPFSDELASSLAAEGVSTELLLRHPARNCGLYAIHNDAAGERHFTYWRSNSAARLTLELLADRSELLLDRPPANFYFSGISLAMLEPASRPAIWPLLEQLQRAGTRIFFDTNYRAQLWQDADAAREAIEQALLSCDCALPGVEDLELLCGIRGGDEARSYLQGLGVREMVLKNGPLEILYGNPDNPGVFAVPPVKSVVDTTAAGDSFNGTMLGGLSRGLPLPEAIARACTVAASVIQHRGAILPRSNTSGQ